MKAAAFDDRIRAAATVRMLASYRLIVDNPRYNQFEHFWVPGALIDYDIPDLPLLVAPRPLAILDPIDHMSRRLTPSALQRQFAAARQGYRLMSRTNGVLVGRTAGTAASVARHLDQVLRLARA